LWLFLFNPSVGLISILLKMIGFAQVNVLTNPTGAMIAVILSSVWMGSGFAFLNLLGALQSVPKIIMTSRRWRAGRIGGRRGRSRFPWSVRRCSS
jgi:ABC-type sugar transport system permease subunit